MPTLRIDIEAVYASALDAFDKLERQATSTLKRVDSAVSSVNATLASLGVGVSLTALGRTFGEAVSSIAALDDAAEKSGASVEALSGILNTLAPTGVTLDQITEATGRLTRAMSGADTESSKAAEAFKALGIESRDAAGNLRPVDQVLNDVATSLVQYEDGTNKTAIAQALFGKAGAELLPMLKDLATRQREAGTVTTEQAAAAEKLANSTRQLQHQFSIFTQDIANSIIPSLNDLLGKLRSIAEISSNPIKWASYLFGDAANVDAAIKSVEADIDRLNKVIAGGSNNAGGRNSAFPAFGTGLLAELAPEVNSARKQVGELQRVLEELKAARETQRKLGVSTVSKVPLQGGYNPGLPMPAPAIPGSAESAKKSTDAAARSFEDYADRIRKAAADAVTQSDIVKAREFADTLQALDELFFNAGLSAEIYDAAVRRLTKSTTVDGAKGQQQQEETLRRQNEQLEKAASNWLDLIEPTRQYLRQIDEIRALVDAGKLTPQQGASAEFTVQNKLQDILDPAAQKVKQVDDAARQLGLTFTSAFEEAAVGGRKLSDVLLGLGQDIAKIFLRKTITEPLTGFLTSAFSGLLPARAAGGPVSAGMPYLVGERGPELLVPKSSGTIVPAGRFGGGVTIVQNVSVGAGVNRNEVAAAMLAAKESAKAEILQSMRRGGAYAVA